MIQLFDAVIAHFAVGCSHGSIKLTRIAELELEFSASENNEEILFTLLVCDL